MGVFFLLREISMIFLSSLVHVDDSLIRKAISSIARKKMSILLAVSPLAP